jgi:hypothetical protein
VNNLTGRARIIVGTAVSLVALLGVAGPAGAAGNGQGNENGNSDAAHGQAVSATAPGNSADAPGQLKKTAEAAPTTDGTVAPTAGGSDHGAPEGSAHGNSTNTPSSAGLKPTNSTSKNFSAAASSSSTKRYGNGDTAGQIAMEHGASGSSQLYSPGNSQPHKVRPCGRASHGNGGGIDVHALKSHTNGSGCSSQQPQTTPKPDQAGSGSAGRPSADPAGVAVTGDPARPTPPSTSTKSKSGPAKTGKAHTGVLTTLGTFGSGALPFTGLRLWMTALIGLAFVGFGLTLRYRLRVPKAGTQ